MRGTNVGEVVNSKMDEVAVVITQDSVKHPLYNKTTKRIVELKAHGENNGYSIDGRARVMETHLLSKEKK